MSDEVKGGAIVVIALIGLAALGAWSGLSCERIQQETIRQCIAAGHSPAECLVSIKAR